MSVVVVVPGGAPDAVELPPLPVTGNAGPLRHVLETTPLEVPVETVTEPLAPAIARQRRPLDQKDVQPTVAVIVQESAAAADGLRVVVAATPAVIVGEPDAQPVGGVAELRDARRV